jgi:hypothetical protein
MKSCWVDLGALFSRINDLSLKLTVVFVLRSIFNPYLSYKDSSECHHTIIIHIAAAAAIVPQTVKNLSKKKAEDVVHLTRHAMLLVGISCS